MHVAVQSGQHECLAVIIEARAELETQDVAKDTAAVSAAKRGQVACLRLLVEAKSDLEAQAADGRHVLEIAEACGIPPLVDPRQWLALGDSEEEAIGVEAVLQLLETQHGLATLRFALKREGPKQQEFQQ